MIDLAGLEARQKVAKNLTASTSTNDSAQKPLLEMMQRLVINTKEAADRAENSVNQGNLSREKLVEARRMQVEAELKLAELRAGMNGEVASQSQKINQIAGGSFAR